MAVCSGCCREEAIARCRWGSGNISPQDASLCDSCIKSLWETLRGLLALNKAWFSIGAVE